AAAQDTTTTLPAVPAPRQQTTVKGTVPDLTGRWLALAVLHIPGNRVRVSPALWDVTRTNGALAIDIRFSDLPPPLQPAIDRQNKAKKEGSPTPEDRAQPGAAWTTLAPKNPQLEDVNTELVGRDAFDDTPFAEPKAKDAIWVVTQSMNFSPTAAPAIRQAM